MIEVSHFTNAAFKIIALITNSALESAIGEFDTSWIFKVIV